MAIRFQCPHGHALKVDDKLAGKKGRCPRCSAMIHIPKPVPKPSEQKAAGGSASGISEDAIIDLLGGPTPAPATVRQHDAHDHHSGDAGGSAEHGEGHDPHGHDSPPMKSCTRCNQSIPSATHICPHCHTYIADLAS